MVITLANTVTKILDSALFFINDDKCWHCHFCNGDVSATSRLYKNDVIFIIKTDVKCIYPETNGHLIISKHGFGWIPHWVLLKQ